MMKKRITALVLAALMLPILSFSALICPLAADGAQIALPENGTTVYANTFDGTASGNAAVLEKLNAATDAYGLADWQLSGTGTLSLADGALNVTATANTTLQLLSGATMDALAKDRDYTVTFDLTYTDGAADDYMGLRLNNLDATNYIQPMIRLRGDGTMNARYDGTWYSLEDDGKKALPAQVEAGTTGTGHYLHSLRKTSGTTPLTLLHETDKTISATYSASAKPLLNKTLHVRVESIHGAGVIFSINGVVLSTTIKNVYYYDRLSELSGTIAMFFSAGTTARIDNFKLTTGGAFEMSTNELGFSVMSLNALMSKATGSEPNDIYSMHWLVDDQGTLRYEALLNVVREQSPDIVGFQERNFTNPSGDGSENIIVEEMVAMGYGVIANKLRVNMTDAYGTTNSKYDAYNHTVIFYKTEKFILLNDSNREDEYIQGKAGITDERVMNGTLVYQESSSETYAPLVIGDVYGTSGAGKIRAQLLIGAQKNSIDTTQYKAVTATHMGRLFGKGLDKKTVTELCYASADSADIRPVAPASTSGWLNASALTQAQYNKITYNASTGKISYDGKTYDGAYVERFMVNPIAVLLTDAGAYNPDTSLYAVFKATDKYSDHSFPAGYTAKVVTELRHKSATAEHLEKEPVTLDAAARTSGEYLDVTAFTKAQYDAVTMVKDGTSAVVYNGKTYKGMYYVRAEGTSRVGQGSSKTLTWGVLRARETGQEFLMMNTHCALLLSYQHELSDGKFSQEAARGWRISNAQQILSVVQRVTDAYGKIPAIITGDFNMRNDDPMYAALSEVFDDTARLAPNAIYWEYSHHTPSRITTPTGNNDSYGNPTFYYKDVSGAFPFAGYPIDHIFATRNDFTITSYNVLNDVYEDGDEYTYGAQELFMTDHCALMVEVTLSGVGTPGCSHKSGIYTDLQQVTLTAQHPADVIYYTLDGTDPASSATRMQYSGAFEVYGDRQLRAVSCRNGVYSEQRVVNFALFAEVAITEIICNTDNTGDSTDYFEGFEVTNISRHSVDLGDYIFWRAPHSTSYSALRDGTLEYAYSMNHMRVQEQGKFILQPGESAFLWTVFGELYQKQAEYAAGQKAYLMDFVTEEGLNDPATVAFWASLGYTGLDKNAVGKTIYRTDLVSAGMKYNLGVDVPKEKIVPMDMTASGARYVGATTTKDGFSRKDITPDSTAPRNLSGGYNMANSVYVRLMISYADALRAEEAFTSAFLDESRGATSGFNRKTNGTFSIYAGSFTMMPEIDAQSGKIYSYATAFNKQNKAAPGAFSPGRTTAEQAVRIAKIYDAIDQKKHYVTIEGAAGQYVDDGTVITLPAAPAGDGVFVGWRTADGKLYPAGGQYTVTAEMTIAPMFISFATRAGAMMRTTEGSTGLRFLTGIDKADHAALSGLVTGLAYGTYIVPQFYVDKIGDFDIAQFSKYLQIPAGGFYAEEGESYILAGSVANIYENHYDMAYAARGYLTFTYADGSTARVYAALPQNGARTVTEVAKAANADRAAVMSERYCYVTAQGDYSPYTERQREIIASFIKIEVRVSLQGSTFVPADAKTPAFTVEYNDLADIVTLVRTDGSAWNVEVLYLDGYRMDFTVNGNRLSFKYSFYTANY